MLPWESVFRNTFSATICQSSERGHSFPVRGEKFVSAKVEKTIILMSFYRVMYV